MSVDVMALWSSSKSISAQIGNLLQVAQNITRGVHEDYSKTVVSVLRDDALARKPLLEELDRFEKGVKELREAVAAKE